MSEPVRVARIAEAYTTSAGTSFRSRSPYRNSLGDTVQISSEAQEKSKQLLLQLKEQSSSDQPARSGLPANNTDLLNLPTNATKDQIRKAYLSAIKQYHPDNFAGLCTEFRQLAEEKSKQINLTYKKLTSN